MFARTLVCIAGTSSSPLPNFTSSRGEKCDHNPHSRILPVAPLTNRLSIHSTLLLDLLYLQIYSISLFLAKENHYNWVI